MAKTLNLTLKVWRQENREAKGRIETYAAKDIPVDASFLEMLDIVNEGLVKEGKEPIHFDHDCREGICGMCSLTINGIPHGPERQVTTCQLHMRKFKDGDTVWIEPFRAKAFPILRDLMVDRSALDRIIAAGGYIDVRTGSAPNANNIAVEKVKADAAFDAAPASAAAPAWPPVKRFRHAVHLRQDRPSQSAAAGPAGTFQARPGHDEADGSGRLWQLHEPV